MSMSGPVTPVDVAALWQAEADWAVQEWRAQFEPEHRRLKGETGAINGSRLWVMTGAAAKRFFETVSDQLLQRVRDLLARRDDPDHIGPPDLAAAAIVRPLTQCALEAMRKAERAARERGSNAVNMYIDPLIRASKEIQQAGAASQAALAREIAMRLSQIDAARKLAPATPEGTATKPPSTPNRRSPSRFLGPRPNWTYAALVVGTIAAAIALVKNVATPIAAWFDGPEELSIKDRYLVAAHPTKIDVKAVEIQYWDGLEKPYLTVIFENQSKLGGKSFRILAPDLTAMKDAPVMTREVSAGSIAIDAGAELPVPIATFADTERWVAEKESGLTVVGAGTEPNLPDGLALKLCAPREGDPAGCVADGTSIIVPLQYTFQTAFGEEIKVVTRVYIYAGRVVSQHGSQQPSTLGADK